jgi:predicted enzyme related to lactoylglutathione lyase
MRTPLSGSNGVSSPNGTPDDPDPQGAIAMDMRLELVPLPTTDVDRSKAFYMDQLGFNLDHDVQPGNGMRVVQLTPPGSACSIVVGVGISDPTAPRVLNLHLVVEDVEEARAQLSSKGVDVSGVRDMGGVKYAYFSDPDGNSWALQELLR